MNTQPFRSYLEQKGQTKRTIENRLVIYGQYAEWLAKEGLEAQEVTYTDLLAYIKHCRQKAITQRTIQSYIGTIKHYYAHLIRERQINYNPARDIKVQGVKRKVIYRTLTPEELHQLYNAYQDESLAGRRNKVMLGLLIYQGLKTEELRKLETKDIKLKEGKIEVSGGRKSNHRTMTLESHQVLEIYDYTLQARTEILKESGEETEKLFITTTGKPSTISNLVRSFLRPLKEQFPHLKNSKQIRASVITKWLKQYNLRETQYLAGHRYISTTESYQQNDVEGLAEEINMYHPL